MQLCLVPEAMKIGRRDGEYEKTEHEMERGVGGREWGGEEEMEKRREGIWHQE